MDLRITKYLLYTRSLSHTIHCENTQSVFIGSNDHHSASIHLCSKNTVGAPLKPAVSGTTSSFSKKDWVPAGGACPDGPPGSSTLTYCGIDVSAGASWLTLGLELLTIHPAPEKNNLTTLPPS